MKAKHNTSIWTSPERDENTCLFMDSVEQLMTALKIDPEELAEWHRLGWVSFDQNWFGPVSSPQCSEVEFICSLTRSGLSKVQIDELLQSLQKPYQYDFDSVAFHPRYKWVSPRNETLVHANDSCRKSRLEEIRLQMAEVQSLLHQISNELSELD